MNVTTTSEDTLRLKALPTFSVKAVQARVFEELHPNFDPATEWLDGDLPHHSHLENSENVQGIGALVKQ